MPLALSHRRSRPMLAGESTVPPIRETDLDRVLKLIPTEALAFYAAAVPAAAEVPWRYFPFLLFLTGCALVPLVLYLDGRSTHQAATWPQYVARTLVFIVWASALLWPFAPWASDRAVGWVRSLGVLIVPFVGAFVLRDRSPAAPPA